MSKLLRAIKKWTLVTAVLVGGLVLMTAVPFPEIGRGSLVCANGCPEAIGENRAQVERLVTVVTYVVLLAVVAGAGLTIRHEKTQ